MAASHEDLVQMLVALVTIARTPGGRAEAADLTAEGRTRAAQLTAGCE